MERRYAITLKPLDDAQQAKIVRLHTQERLPIAILAERFGVSRSAIEHIIARRKTADPIADYLARGGTITACPTACATSTTATPPPAAAAELRAYHQHQAAIEARLSPLRRALFGTHRGRSTRQR